MLVAVCPPDFANNGPAIIRSETGERQEWHPAQLATGERVWIGPHNDLLTDDGLRKLWVVTN
jgi:hypothetical protein